MSAVSIADVVCAIGFGAALLFVIMVPIAPSRAYMRPVKVFMIVAMSCSLFVGVSNVLEWGGVTAALDVYEDYAEVLFIPLMAYLVFALSMSQQLESTRRMEQLARGEQQLLTSIVETSPAGIMVVAADGGVTFANDRARDMLGLRPEEAESHCDVPDDVRLGMEPGGVTGVTEGLLSIAALGRVDDIVRYVEHPGGRTLALDVSARPLAEDGSLGSGAVMALLDVTDRLRYRQDLERAVELRTRELLDANGRLGAVDDANRDSLVQLSHELRTPLDSIIGLTDILLQGDGGPLSEEQAHRLEMVRSCGNQLLAVIDAAQRITPTDAGREAVITHAVDACELVSMVAELIKPIAADRSVDLETEFPDGPLMFMTDADKLAQIVRSLAGSAIKFSHDGGWVRFIARGDADSVSISVADSGVGIAKQDLAHVFDGNGLAVCRDLAILLGGDISVESEEGTGSTFTVRLPRAIRHS
ncbi:MAG: PAS domain-containing sensor histidine kinase [Coriobacteriia bacterium]|nr:PAS domain-containing sensor histidine kinase [Coriobacteriia bacterium]